MKTSIIFATICLALLLSCKKSTTSSTYTPSCTGPNKSWAADVMPVITNNCTGCHSAFTTYSGVFAAKSTIRSKIVDGSMPQGGSLSNDQKNIIVCWIDNGAPNN